METACGKENDVTMTARMTMFEHCKDILTRVASLFAKKIPKRGRI
jgi:hypothetical protein